MYLYMLACLDVYCDTWDMMTVVLISLQYMYIPCFQYLSDGVSNSAGDKHVL